MNSHTDDVIVPGVQVAVTSRGKKSIRFPISEEEYQIFMMDVVYARCYLDQLINSYPEVFPEPISQGYYLNGSTRTSKKTELRCRQLVLPKSKLHFILVPSFILPYHRAKTQDAKAGLFLVRQQVPFWAVAEVCGRNAMFWYRLICSLGRFSVVGTTIRHAEDLPDHVAADEKHTRRLGQKAYIAMTAAQDCVLGVSVVNKASEKELQEGYGAFAAEAENLNPDYQPKTVNTDGWKATQKAWKKLFPAVTLILCFLHAFLKIRDRAKKKHADVFPTIAQKVWDAYHALSRASFSQQLRRLREWAESKMTASIVKDKVLDLCSKRNLFAQAFRFQGVYRTSNQVDRVMKTMDRALFMAQGLHSKSVESATLFVRGWALCWNFAPSCPQTIKKYHGKKSPAERLNDFHYHPDWVQNLMVSGSMNGFRCRSPNPKQSADKNHCNPL